MAFLNMRKIRISITIALMLLFLFANIFSVRQMARYGLELYFYDKLNVAYQIGDMPGLKSELDRAISKDDMPRELKVAVAFKKNLADIDDPGQYLSRMVEDRKQKVNLFRSLRNLAFGLIVLILLLRLALNRTIRRIESARSLDKK